MPPVYPPAALFIDGEWLERPGAPVICPATGETLGSVPHAGKEDLDRALAAAERGFAVWRETAPDRRAEIILEAMRLLRARAGEIATTITLEQGKPLASAKAEVLRGSELVAWDAEEGRRAYGRVIPAPPGFRQSVRLEPIGPVAAFTPWSAPTSAPGRKLGAALAAGCSVVLKAAEETPGGACALVQCFADAGLPAGVVNLVFGSPAEISSHLIASPVIRLVTFTGSVPVGIHLAGLAAARMKPAVMELGGHGPVVVCEDADPLAAALQAAAAKFRNAGQVCISPTRFLVHERHYRPFVEAFVRQAAAIKVGNGLDPDSQMGPLANDRRVRAMEELVEDALALGGRCLTGGKRLPGAGHFFPPTVLEQVPAEARILTEEPFGPVAVMDSFRSLEEAIAKANATRYGLAAYAFTDSAAAAETLSERLEVGHVAINHFGGGVPESPFGGVKESGIGREGGKESLDAYLVTKYVSQRFLAR